MRRAKGSVYRPVVTRRVDGKQKRRRTKFYWASYTDNAGVPQRHVLKLPNGMRITDKDVARSELDKIINRLERMAVGLIDPMVEAAGMPMRVVLARYVRHLRRNKCSTKHVDQVLCYVKFLMAKGEIHRLGEFNEERIDRALGIVAGGGRSPRTVNVYRQCTHSMCEWCIKVARIMDRNPVRAVGRRNEAADTRKVRRSLSIDEARRLLEVCGPRKLFYSVQLWAGIRVAEVRALEWRDLELEGDRPCVRLRAETTKTKRADELPLHPDLAKALAKAKAPFAKPTDRVFKTAPRLRTFKGGWYRRRGERRYLTGDLDRAGIPFEDDRGRTVDLHALRTTFISWLGFYGVDPRAQIMLARHAPQGVTLRNYQDFGVFDLWAQIRKLPPIRAEGEAERLRATGTEHSAPASVRLDPVVRPVVQQAGRLGGSLAADGRNDANVSAACHGEKNLQDKGEKAFFRPQGDSGRQDLNLRLPAPKAGHLSRQKARKTLENSILRLLVAFANRCIQSHS